MEYFVYIIQSLVDNSYYKGFTQDPESRIAQHNSGLSSYTSNKMPWKYIYLEILPAKREALIREKALKKYSHAQIEQLILSQKNSLNINCDH
ncbi:GIY-YIG nuclease family protein [Taibaiella lutea]|uniref:GIY-YIG nuclease family protein n=2 Tax=Taibaiella lutea TaxID=2608001 RepID=A0A5M6CHE1_9BACT|nr:GIY-YIG nuclease family protein [Taibaiella lutea]KAA5534467.1 GIY-YIG nuclease family protein [Taibaiella lutea]